nr:uncharacterized protein LOC104104838 [Nicotiana tomentosiformis]
MAPFVALYGRRCRFPICWFEPERLLIAQSRKKTYEDQKARDLSFVVGEKVAYKLALPPRLSGVHLVFHVSMIQSYNADRSHVLDYSIVQMNERLSNEEEPIALIDRQVHRLRSKEISAVKVQLRGHPVKEAT